MTPKDGLVHLIPLGGFGEIGKNSFVLETHNDLIIVDCGVMFPQVEEHPGIDFVAPDFSYVLERKDKVRGLIITHAHEDHIGAIPFLLKKFGQGLDIYASKLSIAMIKRKLESYQMNAGLIELQPDSEQKLVLGTDFSIETFRVTHSIPDALGLAVDTPAGLLVHTGDFKFDNTPVIGAPTDFGKLHRFASRGVLGLICDSTSVIHKGSAGSDKRVGETLHSLINNCRNRIIVTTFASNFHRVKTIIEAAISCGRKVSLSGRSMEDGVSLALEFGYLDVPSDQFVLPDELEYHDPSEVLVLTTGCQGETNSALYRASIGEHRDIQISPNDRVIFSSKPIPGNERYVNRVINNLLLQGVEVIHSNSGYDVHVSGHGYEDDISWMIALLRPKYLIPYHGEEMHLLAFKNLARRHGYTDKEIITLRLGDSLVLQCDDWKFGDKISVGIQYVDGLSIGEIGNRVLNERIHLQNEGVVVAVVKVDERGKQVIVAELITRGFLYPDIHANILKQAREWLKKITTSYLTTNRYEQFALKSIIQEGLMKFFYEEFKRRPMIIPIVFEINRSTKGYRRSQTAFPQSIDLERRALV